MKKPLLFIILVFALASSGYTQKISSSDLKILRKKEDSLKSFVKNIVVDSFTAGRMRSDSQFIKTLVRGLQVKNSFYFPFDSVRGIGKLYAPDSTFRIFTWQLSFDDYYCRQRGAIQFRTPDGSLKLIPLIDNSEFTDNPNDSIRNHTKWIGAVYYNMVQTKHNGKNYYTLFGFDDNSIRTNKKWIEVLTFDANKMPVFGGQYFIFDPATKRKPQHRYSIEYKKEASTMVNYDPDLDIILVDHLVSETDEPEMAHTFVPDGDYEGFKWVNGRWQHIDKVFNEKLEDGQAPVPDPIRDASGKNNQEKLDKQSDTNKNKPPVKKKDNE